jgi:hypothetical protein
MKAARIAVAGALLVIGGAAAAVPSQSEHRAALRNAAATYNAARAHCRTLSGQDKRVCIAEAKAALNRANAQAEAAYRNTPRARLDAHVTEANADYAVARVKCSAQSGAARRACLDAAKAEQADAITKAMRATQ